MKVFHVLPLVLQDLYYIICARSLKHKNKRTLLFFFFYCSNVISILVISDSLYIIYISLFLSLSLFYIYFYLYVCPCPKFSRAKENKKEPAGDAILATPTLSLFPNRHASIGYTYTHRHQTRCTSSRSTAKISFASSRQSRWRLFGNQLPKKCRK